MYIFAYFSLTFGIVYFLFLSFSVKTKICAAIQPPPPHDVNSTQLLVRNTTAIEHVHGQHMRTAPARSVRIAGLYRHSATRCAHVVAVVAAAALARDAEVTQSMLQFRRHVSRMLAQHAGMRCTLAVLSGVKRCVCKRQRFCKVSYQDEAVDVFFPLQT